MSLAIPRLSRDPLNRDKRLSVRVHDSPLRYLVTSKSRRGIEYLVDLETMECQCEDFTYRHLPNRMKYRLSKSVTMCKHCDAAFKYFSLGMLESVIALVNKRGQSTEDDAI